ncbi:MAG: hypothetical protein KA007_02435 [Candidatus Pacebacteria bacterium]|jgi:cbb3-type cytochrome oxidase subunit 3|nr:hypothetical protein [Candidatus Paceibacterota bacterium]
MTPYFIGLVSIIVFLLLYRRRIRNQSDQAQTQIIPAHERVGEPEVVEL